MVFSFYVNQLLTYLAFHYNNEVMQIYPKRYYLTQSHLTQTITNQIQVSEQALRSSLHSVNFRRHDIKIRPPTPF